MIEHKCCIYSNNFSKLTKLVFFFIIHFKCLIFSHYYFNSKAFLSVSSMERFILFSVMNQHEKFDRFILK